MEPQKFQPTVMRFVRHGREYFYHTMGRGYVDLDDLLYMREEGEPFMVWDAETGTDVTRVLLA